GSAGELLGQVGQRLAGLPGKPDHLHVAGGASRPGGRGRIRCRRGRRVSGRRRSRRVSRRRGGGRGRRGGGGGVGIAAAGRQQHHGRRQERQQAQHPFVHTFPPQ